MANVMFKKGLLAGLPTAHVEGTFYVTTDERAIYLDIDDSTRIRLGDFQEFATLEALNANANPSTTALYYVDDINCLAKWDGSKYIQINRDTGFTSFEIVGDGNAITAIAVDENDARKLVITKGATYATEEALNDLKDRVDVAEGKIEALEADAHTHANADELNKIVDGDVAKWNAAEQNAKDHADTEVGKVTEALNTYKTANDAAVKAAADAAAAAQGDVDALEEKVGQVPADKTVVQMIADAQTAATYDDTQVKADIAANAAAIKTEKERMDAFMKLEDGQTLSDALDSLKEIQDFITNEANDADILLGKVSALEGIVAGIGGDGEHATVVAHVQAAIDALKIGDYAKVADLTAAIERIAAMEAKVPNWDAAEQNAKDHADGLNTAMNARVEALEAIDHDHANAAELDKIVDGDVAKWNAAQANAEATAAAALAEAKTELEGDIADEVERAAAAEAQVLADAKAYADQQIAIAHTWGSF